MILSALGFREAATEIREGRVTSTELVTRARPRCRGRARRPGVRVSRPRSCAEPSQSARRASRPWTPNRPAAAVQLLSRTCSTPTTIRPSSAHRSGRVVRPARTQWRWRCCALRGGDAGRGGSAEYAYLHPGKTRNRTDKTRTPGGSSMGSAAAVATFVVPARSARDQRLDHPPRRVLRRGQLRANHGLIPRTGTLLLCARSTTSACCSLVEDVGLLAELIGRIRRRGSRYATGARPPLASTAVAEPPLPPALRLREIRILGSGRADHLANAFAELVEALDQAVSEVDLGDEL